MGVTLTEAFEALRPRLFGLAYRMLGSRAEAEDILQEAYLRWHQTDRQAIENPEAWLVRMTSRLAIDQLRRLKSEREAYVGPWLPEPIVSLVPPPDRDVNLAEDLSIAFLTLLERLAPEERAAFLLHEVFDVRCPQIAQVLGKSEAACRQIVHRASERVRGKRKRFHASEVAKRRLLQTFLTALEAGDDKTLLALFAPDATWTTDSGGKVAASLHPIFGAEQIVHLVLLGFLRENLWAAGRVVEIATINGEPGLWIHDGGCPVGVIAIETDGEQILNMYGVGNPDKLHGGPA
jgi:RNA polymerase sigma-70 factor (ECF subfamily)